MYNNNNNNYNNRGWNYRSIALMNEMRKLWEQHIMWTRSFIVSTASDLPDLSLVTARLLRNPSDFANVFRRFYGARIADQLKKLFTEHLLLAAKLVNEAKAGNAQGVETVRKQWYENSNDIAKFLASINPYWNEGQWKSMLHEHLKMTEDEAVYTLTGQHQKSIDIYDEIQSQALRMADYMTNGIRRQFSF